MAFVDSHREEFVRAIAHFQQEIRALRTGRANPSMIELINVDAYGTPTPLVQLASITTPEPTQLLVQPWDPNLVKNVEKAIQASPLGITPTVDGQGIRLHFPPLTEERRKELARVVREKAEMARVAIRSIREDIHKSLKQSEKDGSLSEDQVAQEGKALQTVVDEYSEKIAALTQQKEAELEVM